MTPQDDDDLRSSLRAGDPARGVAPLDPEWTVWRAARIVDGDGASSPGSVPPRQPRTRPIARAAAMLTGIGAVAAAATLVLTTGGAGGATALSLPPADGPAAVCAAVGPDTLRRNDLAFEARALRVDGGTVTLEVTRRFKGHPSDEVTVPQPSPGLSTDAAPGPFRPGARYLVAADRGAVAVCGQTGPATAELSALYEQAFRR